jgi:hypothetical protein
LWAGIFLLAVKNFEPEYSTGWSFVYWKVTIIYKLIFCTGLFHWISICSGNPFWLWVLFVWQILTNGILFTGNFPPTECFVLESPY